MSEPANDIVPNIPPSAPDDEIKYVAKLTDETIDAMGWLCQHYRDVVTGEIDARLATCDGTLSDCLTSVREYVDRQTSALGDEMRECRDAIRSQAYVRIDEYFIQAGYEFPELRDVVPPLPPPMPSPGGYDPSTEFGEWLAGNRPYPVPPLPPGQYYINTLDNPQIPYCPGPPVAYTRSDGVAVALGVGIAGTDVLPCNGGSADAGTPIPVPPVPGIPDSPTFERGECDDSSLRTACEQAGGRWSQGRCYFTPPVNPGNDANGQGGHSPCPGGVITVVDNYGGSCPATCLVDSVDGSKIIVQLSGNARLWCGPCPPGTFTIRDRRANATDNSCQATCVEGESEPGRAVLLLPNGAELFCGPCGKPEDNPVGIEQPQAFRFQQRQSPWFRDAINWAGQVNIDFYNSPTQEDYLREGERLRSERNEP